jgi:hypothetical protein
MGFVSCTVAAAGTMLGLVAGLFAFKIKSRWCPRCGSLTLPVRPTSPSRAATYVMSGETGADDSAPTSATSHTMLRSPGRSTAPWVNMSP